MFKKIFYFNRQRLNVTRKQCMDILQDQIEEMF